jgi:hypothetical protein
MRDKAYQLKPLLTDRNALSQCDTEIRECQKYIEYFTEELAKMENKKELDNDPSTIGAADGNLTTNDGSIPPRTSNIQTSLDNHQVKKYSTLGNAKHYTNMLCIIY